MHQLPKVGQDVVEAQVGNHCFMDSRQFHVTEAASKLEHWQRPLKVRRAFKHKAQQQKLYRVKCAQVDYYEAAHHCCVSTAFEIYCLYLCAAQLNRSSALVRTQVSTSHQKHQFFYCCCRRHS